MNKVDLHVHTNASDGRFSPADIILKAHELKLAYIAITDHDTVSGIFPALETAKTLSYPKVIPGVELSADIPEGEVHILGYFINCQNKELQASLEIFRNSRLNRALKMTANLQNLGINIDWKRVAEIAGDSTIGRPHIAQAMLEKGYITTFKDAFNKYIGRDCPAYVPREKMTPVEAVKLVLQADGLPVMAHPFTVSNPEQLIIQLQSSGLVGIEAYYNNYNASDMKRLVRLAEQYNLCVTGGSDYHGIDMNNETMIGDVDLPFKAVEQLLLLAEQSGLKPALQEYK